MTKRREDFYKRNEHITKELDKHFKEWMKVKDYYKQEKNLKNKQWRSYGKK